MTYTPKDFRNDIIKEIEKGFDPIRIGQAAYDINLELGTKISTDFHNEILGVMVMEAGPEFEMTESELRDYLDRMVDKLKE
ncbi:hypothetical protein [Gimesia aquarii]|uniref:Uncharacterized protein n=1 Tax=Gimesia aquarii TaxID=2527964 RepID=A0A517WVF8_9PLAN|nr:hypothetical protein [Gimesia aquarii]QDU09243.1 hypothetical protein V202x_26160 [Gimesia aquarii]